MEKEIAGEQKLKQYYYLQFQQKDTVWWKNEISRMNNIHDPKLQPVYQRLLGFISLAGYTISSTTIQQGQFDIAWKMLSIYKLADPQNPDQPFLKACFYAKQNENDNALNELRKAIALGWNDKSKLLNEPCFASIKNLPGFQEIIEGIKNSE
jgi:hypothetical protein